MDFPTYLEQLGPAAAAPENRVVVARVDSTNRLARRVVSALTREGFDPPDAVVFALEQTAGRGRHGRSWSSPAGGGVYASRVLPVADPRDLATVPLLAAVGLAAALRSLLPTGDCRLKWPNDLVVGGRKIGGVLVESVTLPDGGAAAIIGFGVNDRERGEPGVLERLGATCLAWESGRDLPLGELARRLLSGLEDELSHLGDTAYSIRRFRELTIHHAGDPIRCRTGDGVVEGELLGFEERGFLRLRGPDGVERAISSGEIVQPAPDALDALDAIDKGGSPAGSGVETVEVER